MFDLSQVLQNGVPDLPAAALFFLFFFGTFVSEDAACLLAGAAAASGRMSFVLALTACFLGIFVGDVLLYAAGRKFGQRIFDSKFVKRFVSDLTIESRLRSGLRIVLAEQDQHRCWNWQVSCLGLSQPGQSSLSSVSSLLTDHGWRRP